MKIVATIEREDFAKLLSELLPARIELGEGRRIALSKPELVELVPGEGLRVRGSARVTWVLAGITIKPRLRTWQVLLVPKVVERRGCAVLALEPKVETLDFEVLPGFADDLIADAANTAIAGYSSKLAWAFEKALALRVALPTVMTPQSRLELRATHGEVDIAAMYVRLIVTFEAKVARAGTKRASGAAHDASAYRAETNATASLITRSPSAP